jgi:hypothetical protein
LRGTHGPQSIQLFKVTTHIVKVTNPMARVFGTKHYIHMEIRPWLYIANPLSRNSLGSNVSADFLSHDFLDVKMLG